MRIYDNGEYRDATPAEEAMLTAPDAMPEAERSDPLEAFFAGLASGSTNSIAKIRLLAQEFLDQTATNSV